MLSFIWACVYLKSLEVVTQRVSTAHCFVAYFNIYLVAFCYESEELANFNSIAVLSMHCFSMVLFKEIFAYEFQRVSYECLR